MVRELSWREYGNHVKWENEKKDEVKESKVDLSGKE